MKLMILGGMGYLGSRLADRATEAGHEVLLYDSLIYEQESKTPHQLVIGDTRNAELLEITLALFEPDFVFHFAELSSHYACEHNPILTEDVNYRASKKVMDICKEYKVIYNSSSSIYSGTDNYTKYKLLMEEYVKDMPNVIVFRPATVFGLSPRFRIELLPNHFVYMALKGHITISGAGNYRAAIDIDDLIDGYLKVIEKGSWNQQVYDIGHFNMTKLQFAEETQKIFPCEIITTDKIFDTRDLTIDCSTFEKEFDWKPKTSYQVSIIKIGRWIKEHRAEIEETNFRSMLNMPLDMWKSICN